MTSDLQNLPVPSHDQPRQLQAIEPELTIAELVRRQKLVQACLKEVMVDGHHYGVIPGTQKRSLLKPGTEKLCALFRLSPTFQTVQKDLQQGHREYRVICTLTHQGSGMVIATGEGLCTTMESKYRWRLASRKCPKCGAEAIRKGKAEYGGGFFCSDKQGGCKAKFKDGDRAIIDQPLGKVENPDIADAYNTVLKMAAKRAAAAACLVATACSDIFMEDGDEEPGDYEGHDDIEEPPRETRRTRSNEPHLSRRQELARDCARAVSALDAPREKVAEFLTANGVPQFEKWGELDEPTLERVLGLLEAKLREGKPLA